MFKDGKMEFARCVVCVQVEMVAVLICWISVENAFIPRWEHGRIKSAGLKQATVES